MSIPSPDPTMNELAVSNGTGECPEGSFLRALSSKTESSAVAVLQTSDGQTPYAETMREILSLGQIRGATNGVTVGAAARFAGQEGETPLTFAVRSIR
jgi:hypothetical protein